MEKPPGASLKEAEAICALVEEHRARVMVSMNRRFDPSVAAACAWRGGRPIERIRATMLRHNRRDTDFFFGTAIHSVDALRRLAGDVGRAAATSRLVDGVRWYRVNLEFASGADGTLDVAPTCGSTEESYEVFGPGYRVRARVGVGDGGEFVAWENGSVARREEPAAGLPPFVVNGAYGETVEFISALLENRAPHPTPAEVLPSVELCSRIQRENSSGRRGTPDLSRTTRRPARHVPSWAPRYR